VAVVLTEAERKRFAGTLLFHTLSDVEMEDVLARPACLRLTFAKGAVIYAPRTFYRSLGVLLTGAVEVTKGALIVSILHEGELFGAAALFNEEADYATTLTARAPCEVIFFPQTLMTEMMEEHPALAMAYVRYLSGRIRFLNDKIEDLIAGSAEERLLQYLMAHMEGDQAVLDCSATDLAKRLNMSRASLYRAFETLQATGMIDKDRKNITITSDTERN